MKFQVIVRPTAEQKLSCKHTQKNDSVCFHQSSGVAKHIASVPSSLLIGGGIFSLSCRSPQWAENIQQAMLQTLHLPCLVPLTETDRGAWVLF